MNTESFELVIPTGEGEFIAEYSVHGLTGLSFPQKTTRLRQRAPVPHELLQQISAWHRVATKALKTILTGKEPPELPPLDIVGGTDFQRKVWQAMRAIPWGQTASYGDIARRIGRPKAVRAVGGACGANSIPVFVPCHRVLAAQGKIGGFSSGLDWKRKLLALEGTQYRSGASEERR